MAQSRAEAIASSFQQAKEDPPTEEVAIGIGGVILLFLIGHFISKAHARRLLEKRKREKAKRVV
ncbi:MAG: hypothetical protein HQL80_06380 [Magnetococcales bacterium]|nr:hypothetical protein [Magnetococcales bacterium]